MTPTKPFLPKDLENLLEQEYAALLSGNLNEIERLGAAKALALDKISELPEKKFEEFAFLRPNLFRNQELAKSAIIGMRQALSRVKAIFEVRSELKTYDSSGLKNMYLMRSGDRLSKRS